METKFQTSFIPKKPITSSGMSHSGKAVGMSVFVAVSVLMFIASLAIAGGAYFWNQYLISAQESYKTQLVERQRQFNVELIQELKQENTKIDYAKQLLTNHLAMSGIFDIIGKMTIEKARFLSLDVTAPPASQPGDLKVTMSGYATDFSAVAFQSDILGRLEQYGLRKIVKNPILSNPALDATGAVSFSLSATIDPTSLSYENTVTGAAATSTATSSPSDSGTTNQ
jgi:hypothetical protein